MLTTDVIARLQNVKALSGKVAGALDYSALIKSSALPPRMPAAFVLPLGFDAQKNDMATGVHRQLKSNTVAVILVISAADDIVGTKAVDPVESLVAEVEGQLAGWQPPSSGNVMNVKRARLWLNAGAAFVQLDFSTDSFVRITP